MATRAPPSEDPSMPANLTPAYKDAEARFRAAADGDEKLDALREMLALLPKHKGTEKIASDLKKRIAKLEDEATHVRGGAHHAEIGRVPPEGAGQWILVGPPNAGKSSLLRALTHARPEVAEYPFTTRAPQPGMMAFEDVLVQLVDTPAVAPAHAEGWLANLLRNADGAAIVLDPTADDVDASVHAIEEQFGRARIWPEVRPLPPDASPLLARKPVVVVANKRDLDPDGTFAALARDAVGTDLPFFTVSATGGEGLEALRGPLFRLLRRIRVHSKEPGRRPEPGKPFVLPEGATVQELAARVHGELAQRLRFARIWGHARFEGQQVDRGHVLADGDVVELHA
jgi:uncharacterized protein